MNNMIIKNQNDKMNILVVGTSGAGKSTLISSISGTTKKTNFGEGDTRRIEISESSTWPFRFIDTKGFEYGFRARKETKKQIQKFTKRQLSDSASVGGIDAIWYCVEGTSRRLFNDNDALFMKMIKKWNNTPVFIVVTKSYSETEAKENVSYIQNHFKVNEFLNIKDVIPLVAKAYPINNDSTNPIIISPFGIPELCKATLACKEEANQINEANLSKMILEQKRFEANAFIAAYTTCGSVIGGVPLSFSDSFLLVPLETAMVTHILKIYGIKGTPELISAIIGSTAVTNAAKFVLAKLKAVPSIAAKIATGVLNAIVAGVIIEVIGQCLIALSEAIFTGKISVEDLNAIKAFLDEKLLNNEKIRKKLDAVIKKFEKKQDE